MARKGATQAEVLRLMAEGWELGHDTAFGARGGGCWGWLQRGGLGRGGECIDVHGSVAKALIRRGLIRRERLSFPTERWVLRDDQ